GVTRAFTARASRALALALCVTTLAGMLDYSRLTSVGRWYVQRVDPRAFHFVGLQSIFWHPGWFAWYFVVAFGCALGLWTMTAPGRRTALGVVLVACYLCFLLNPERGGLAAVHVMLAVFAWHTIRASADPLRAALRMAAMAVPILLAAAVLLGTAHGRLMIARAGLLSIERTVNNASTFLQSDGGAFQSSERLKLWTAAMRMWRSA